jgi:hypothetical protein
MNNVSKVHPCTFERGLTYQPGTKHNSEYAVALRSTQIASLRKSEKSMLYFSQLFSSPQGAEATSHIRETLEEIFGKAAEKARHPWLVIV